MNLFLRNRGAILVALLFISLSLISAQENPYQDCSVYGNCLPTAKVTTTSSGSTNITNINNYYTGNNGTGFLTNYTIISSGGICSSGGVNYSTYFNSSLGVISFAFSNVLCNGSNGIAGTNGTNGLNGSVDYSNIFLTNSTVSFNITQFVITLGRLTLQQDWLGGFIANNITQTFVKNLGFYTPSETYNKTEVDGNLTLRYLNSNPSNYLNITNSSYVFGICNNGTWALSSYPRGNTTKEIWDNAINNNTFAFLSSPRGNTTKEIWDNAINNLTFRLLSSPVGNTSIDIFAVTKLHASTCSSGQYSQFNGSDFNCTTASASSSGNSSWNESYARGILFSTNSTYNLTYETNISNINSKFFNSNSSFATQLGTTNTTLNNTNYSLTQQINANNQSAIQKGSAYSNSTTLDCSNVTGATSNLCTITGGASTNFFNQQLNTTSNVVHNNFNASGNVSIGTGTNFLTISSDGVNTLFTSAYPFVFNKSINATSIIAQDLTAASCDVKSYTNGSLYCGTDATGVLTNFFNQQLNTTSNVTYNNLTITTNISTSQLIFSSFGQAIDNVISGIMRIVGSLRVEGTINSSGMIYYNNGTPVTALNTTSLILNVNTSAFQSNLSLTNIINSNNNSAQAINNSVKADATLNSTAGVQTIINNTDAKFQSITGLAVGINQTTCNAVTGCLANCSAGLTPLSASCQVNYTALNINWTYQGMWNNTVASCNVSTRLSNIVVRVMCARLS